MSAEPSNVLPTLEFLYTNYKGETAFRKVVEPKVVFKSSPYHNSGEPCWILEATDIEKGEIRDFEMSSIHSFETIPF